MHSSELQKKYFGSYEVYFVGYISFRFSPNFSSFWAVLEEPGAARPVNAKIKRKKLNLSTSRKIFGIFLF